MIEDNIMEEDETFLVRLEVPPTENGVMLGLNTTTIILKG